MQELGHVDGRTEFLMEKEEFEQSLCSERKRGYEEGFHSNVAYKEKYDALMQIINNLAILARE